MSFKIFSLTSAFVVMSAMPGISQNLASPLYKDKWFFGATQPYVRIGLGGENFGIDGANWRNGPSDPTVYFDLSEPDAAIGSVSVGKSWRSGLRGELALTAFGEKDVAGPWSYTVPASPGPHASMAASVKSTAIMGNLYYDFPTPRAVKVRPFVMAGVGWARNTMSDWTRTNPASLRPTRTFEGKSNNDIAFSFGLGASIPLEIGGFKPATLDVMYQYFDLGTAEGSPVPLPGSGNSQPGSPLSFGVSSQVISVGIRFQL